MAMYLKFVKLLQDIHWRYTEEIKKKKIESIVTNFLT